MSSVQIRLIDTDSFRHAAVYTLLFVGSMAVLITVVYFILDHSYKANLLREISDDLTSIRTAYAVAKHGREEHEAKEMIDDRMLAPDSDDVYLLERGSVKLAGNLPAMAPRSGLFYLPFPATFAGKTAGHVILGRGEALSKDDYVFVGEDLYEVNRTEHGVLYAFGLVLLASLLLASASGLVLSRSFLRRVDAITDTCTAIMAGRLGHRIPTVGRNNELERLSDVINAMLDRNQTLMESLRQVSTDIAHDLRTPLTHLRHRLERARNDAVTTEDYAGAVDAAITDCDQLLAIFTALLRIAQIEAGARRSEFRDVALEELVARVRDIYRPVMDDSRHPLEVRVGRQARVRGDTHLLTQLISNLLENAIHHTPDGTPVILECGVEDDRPFLAVADRGPGIPQCDRANVLKRFFRREQSRTTPGSGLGLSLVAAIADVHNATLELADNNPGLRVVLTFF